MKSLKKKCSKLGIHIKKILALLTKTTINKQVQIGYFLLLIIIMGMGGILYYNAYQTALSVKVIDEQVAPAFNISELISNDLSNQIKKIYASEAGVGAEPVTNSVVTTNISRMKEYVDNPRAIEMLNEIKELDKELIKQLNELKKTKKGTPQRQLILVRLNNLEQKIKTAINSLGSYSWDNLDNAIDVAVNQTNNIIKVTVAMIIVGLLISLTLALIIRAEINKITSNIKDRTYQAADKSEVVTSSAQAMKKIADNVEKNIRRALSIIQNVTNGNSEVVTAVEEVTTAIQDVSHGVEELSNQSEIISQAGQNTYQAIQQTDQKIKLGSEIANRTVKTMRELQESISKVGNISDRIIQITDQTNLLALNAAIEAARAGEYGRGFTVVAEEIKDLANESMQATQEVRTIISEIKEVAQKAIIVMTKSEEGNKHKDSIVDVLSEVNYLSSGVLQKMEDVIDAAEVQVAATEQLGAVVEQISASSEEVLAETNQTLDSTKDMEELMEEVTGNNLELHSKIKEQADISKEQLNAIKQVIEANKKLK